MRNSLEANAYYKRQNDYAKLAFEKNNLMPRRYVFILTNLCNLACWFCVQERKKKENFMKGDEWLNVIQQIPKNSRITMTGGEPMVFKDFNKIFARANELGGIIQTSVFESTKERASKSFGSITVLLMFVKILNSSATRMS